MSYLHYLCLFENSVCPTHIVLCCCFFVFLWINTTYNLKSSKQAIANDLDNALKIKFLNGKSKCVLLNVMVSMFSVGICNVHDAIL